jgi:hypothetical protein
MCIHNCILNNNKIIFNELKIIIILIIKKIINRETHVVLLVRKQTTFLNIHVVNHSDMRKQNRKEEIIEEGRSILQLTL